MINSWCLYLLECKGGRLYAGITNRLEARFAAHLAGKGAKFTRAFPPVRLLAVCPYPDRAVASRAEWTIKQLPKAKKLAWLQQQLSDNQTKQGIPNAKPLHAR